MIHLWLDDDKENRSPPPYSQCGLNWTWVYSADEAIAALKQGTIEFASLDHDLCDEHYVKFVHAAYQLESTNELEDGDYDTTGCEVKTGLDVLIWMRDNNVWPKDGVRIHTMNTIRKPIMLEIVRNHYGRTFQHQYENTHRV